MQQKVVYTAVLADNLGGDVLPALLHRLADVGHEHAIAAFIVEGRVLIHGEGQDAPVDAVAAVALGGELIADIGKAAQHLLTGGCLLPGGAVAGLVGKHGRAELGASCQLVGVTHPGKHLAQAVADGALPPGLFLLCHSL